MASEQYSSSWNFVLVYHKSYYHIFSMLSVSVQIRIYTFKRMRQERRMASEHNSLFWNFVFFCLLSHGACPNQNLHVPGITKTRLFKYIENFTTKNWKFSDKEKAIESAKSDFFFFFFFFFLQSIREMRKGVFGVNVKKQQTYLFKCTENFTTKKCKFSDKKI